MVLNMKIDLDFLNEGFELAAFNGLRKKHAEYDDKYENEMLLLPQQSSTKIHDHPDVLSVIFFVLSRVTFLLNINCYHVLVGELIAGFPANSCLVK